MTVGRRDQVRQGALAKARRLDAARKVLGDLTYDECQVIYIELESRLTEKAGADVPARASEKAVPTRRHCRVCGEVGHNSQTCTKQKKAPTPKKKTSKTAPKPKWTDMIEQIIRENPQGLRTYEISKKTGQSDPNAYGILKLLERQRRIERHGERYNTLWTLPGIVPVPRIETIPAAAVHLLSKTMEPMDGRKLRDEISKLLVRNIGKKPHPESLKTEISRLISKDIIIRSGANEHGPMYLLVTRKGGDTATTLN
jgi:hypothetical protein